MAAGSEVLCSIPGATTFSEKQLVWNGVLSLVKINEELLERKSSGSGFRKQINGCGEPFRCQRKPLYPQNLALTSPTIGGRSVHISRLRIKSHGVCLFV
jgi:hypothetical protein